MSGRSWDDLVDINKRQEYGTTWRPDREEDGHPTTLVGVVAAYDQANEPSAFTGERDWICTIEERGTGKLWAVWLSRQVLKNEFQRHQPAVDERIVLRYRGTQEKATKGNSPAHLYSLTVDRETALPEFLTRPALGDGERRRDLEVDPTASDVPGDASEFSTYGRAPAVTDAEVVDDEKKSDDDDIPF